VQAVYATGTVEAVKMVAISPKTTARLVALNIDEGEAVQAGDILAQLEDTNLQGTMSELVARRDLAQNDMARAEKLAKAGAVSKEALDSARTQFKTANAALDRTKAEIDFLKLIAPESGTIIRRDGEMGEVIAAGMPVFWINAGDSLRIETEVDEEDIALVKPGQKVIIRADAFDGQIFEGTVQSITPKGDAVARTYRVRISLPQETPLMIGMTVETNIITAEKDSALMIPLAAVRDNAVIVIKDGKAIRQEIQTGIRTTDSVEVVGGMTDKDMIVQNFDATLLDEKPKK
jgi:membrane fusion protein, multidrug efflux system